MNVDDLEIIMKSDPKRLKVFCEIYNAAMKYSEPTSPEMEKENLKELNEVIAKHRLK